ncbi:MAG: hypothetical protein GX166_07650 [Clostridiaceae bacterium]|jgi:uncharacterized coiled-coil protein SlyX|nr:hypothetical protein [Clostridiaceae bacterium]
MEKTLEQRIEGLEKRVAELERRAPEQPTVEDIIEKLNNFKEFINDIQKDNFSKVKEKPQLKKPQ